MPTVKIALFIASPKVRQDLPPISTLLGVKPGSEPDLCCPDRNAPVAAGENRPVGDIPLNLLFPYATNANRGAIRTHRQQLNKAEKATLEPRSLFNCFSGF